MLGMMQYNYLKIKFLIFLHAFLLSNLLIAQKYIFEGDPQLIFEVGSFKQNYNTGLFFYNTNQWELAIKLLKRCDELTRRKTIHYKPLAWSHIYIGDYTEAAKFLKKIKNKKHADLVRLVLKDLKKLPKRKKIGKEFIDKIYREKRDLVKEAKRKTIALAKIEVSNHGP